MTLLSNIYLRATYNTYDRGRHGVRWEIESKCVPLQIVWIILSEIGVVHAVNHGYITHGRIRKSTAHDYHLSAIDDITGRRMMRV